MPDFDNSCIKCGKCRDACPFLAEFGGPDKILAGQPEASFCCTSCRRCETLCPLKLSPAAAFLKTKERLIREEQLSFSIRKTIDGTLAFARAGHRFPFSFYEKAQTVFWPGCGLAANLPQLVRKARGILDSCLGQKVGLVLDCCYDPVFTLGDTNTTLTAIAGINKRLWDGGVQKVITGCLNCHKLFSEHLQGVEVVFILEVIPPEIFPKQEQNQIYLHHPCPSARWEGVREAAQKIVGRIYQSDIPPTGTPPPGRSVKESTSSCCGVGGGLVCVSPELADRFLTRIVADSAGRTIVTYCSGCQDRFLKRGAKAVHLLEHLIETLPGRPVTSPVRQWTNRLILATEARLKSMQ